MKEEISLSKNDSAIENLVIRWWGEKTRKRKKHIFYPVCVFVIYLKVSV
jgi:hypothetical protein